MKLGLVPALLMISCTPAAGVPSQTDTTSYDAEQLACVQDADAAAAADSCRAASRARFCVRFPTMPNCVADGGGQ